MEHIRFNRLIILLLVCSTAFAVINNGGTNYSEALMPLSQSGTGTYYFVVMGSNLTVTAGGNSVLTTFTINGTSYKNTSNSAVAASADDRYYIVYSGKKSTASISISGTNDWTTQTYTPKTAPFSQSGAGSYFFSTTDALDSVVTSNMDFFLINNASHANSTVTSIPSKINGTYYFYYGTTSTSGSLDVKRYTPELNVKLFMEGGL